MLWKNLITVTAPSSVSTPKSEDSMLAQTSGIVTSAEALQAMIVKTSFFLEFGFEEELRPTL